MTVNILTGDCRDVLATLPDRSVQCCVTSPPYFGLRDYGTATWDGGDAGCDHMAGSDYGEKSDTNKGAIRGGPFKDTCGKCGATRIDSQIGLEQTPDAYVAEMVAVFRDVRRVLRDDGTLWLNLGDSYASGGGVGQPHRDSNGGIGNNGTRGTQPYHSAGGGFSRPNTLSGGTKPKDLLGIPWLVAFALRADGWYLRQDIIWAKPNPMPESVTDRCTKAHEYVFLLSKSARYFYDAKAVAEPSTGQQGAAATFFRPSLCREAAGRNERTQDEREDNGTRNRRSVWTIATQPYSGAHFATMPPDLAETCIKAGSVPGDMILDPFGGAGTTALVADRLQRDATIIELNPTYAALARDRINGEAGLFSPVAAE